MIQDIAPHVYHNEYKPVPPTADSFILSFEDKKILFHQAGPETEISFLRFRELEGKLPSLYENYIYLFSIDDDHFYLIPNLDISLADNYELHSIRELRTASSCLCRHHRTPDFPVVPEPSILRLLRNTDEARHKGANDALPFLWPS